MTLSDGLTYLHRSPRLHPDAGEGRHTAGDLEYERIVCAPPPGYDGRHRLPYGCDPEGWRDGLVFWSTSAARWMRVTGYADEPLS